MTDATISKATALDRRQFLKVTGGVLLAMTFPAGTHRALADTNIPANATGTAYIRIGADESITILVGGGEMGQGIFTGLAMGAAEELKVKWETVKVEPIPALVSWLSAGSGGIRSRLPTFLKAGAAAREMLIDVEAQMQGGIFHGLSAAKWGELKWTAGKSSVTNFNKYRMTRLSEAPAITTTIVNSGAPMTGCGEPGVPPIAPAVANAYARLTGIRIRNLPFFPGATMGG